MREVKLFNYVKDFQFLMFAGNLDYELRRVTPDADEVFEWNGDKEEWTVHGTILERRGRVGVSLVPLSSGLLDHCISD